MLKTYNRTNIIRLVNMYSSHSDLHKCSRESFENNSDSAGEHMIDSSDLKSQKIVMFFVCLCFMIMTYELQSRTSY